MKKNYFIYNGQTDLYSNIGTKRFNKHRSEKSHKPSYITKAQKNGTVLRIIRFVIRFGLSNKQFINFTDKSCVI